MTRDTALLFHNGRIHTLDAAGTAAAMAIADGRVLAVGTLADIAAGAGADARRVDLHGHTVLPGLIDAHTHLERTALHRVQFAVCHAPPHRDVAGILAALAAQAGPTPAGEWVIDQSSFMLAEKLA